MGSKNTNSQESTIGKSYKCPNCEKIFPAETLSKSVNEHIFSFSKI